MCWLLSIRVEDENKVVLLGSSRLLLQRGLSDSLAGRFEIIFLGHWSYAEMREAFGWDLNRLNN